VIVRDHEIEHGHFFLDPCNLHPEQEHIVAERLLEELGKAALSNDVIATSIEEVWLARERGILAWPD
jgi:L-seryl-tRNA(Ser) seleniumtransferase